MCLLLAEMLSRKYLDFRLLGLFLYVYFHYTEFENDSHITTKYYDTLKDLKIDSYIENATDLSSTLANTFCIKISVPTKQCRSCNDET